MSDLVKLLETIERKSAQLDEALNQRDAAYAERNKLVAWLASLFPSCLAKTAIEDWEPDWEWCVYIETPQGQMSWHIHNRELELFEHVERGAATWDGHTTEEKYRRVAVAARAEEGR